MDQYVTGAAIRRLREKCGLTQAELAETLHVSDKAVSKWETGKGYPDITLLEPLAAALRVSVIELLSGNDVTNQNRAFNMARTRFYVCPVCGNVIVAAGEATVCCCGVTLPPAEAEAPDADHPFTAERVEDEWYVTASHEMSKTHFITFFAALYDNGVQVVKTYPEGPAEARFKAGRVKMLFACCNRHGLFRFRP